MLDYSKFVDATIFIVFLAATLIVAMKHAKTVKTASDYAVGDRNFSTVTLAATLAATWIGGGFFALTISKTYTDGLSYIILGFGEVVAFFILAKIIAPRMVTFLGSFSVAESLGELYGKNARIITALAGLARVIGTIAIQFKVCSTILAYFVGFSSLYATIISALVIILYSAFGGIKAVTFTDVVQFITFSIFIPILSLVIWGTISSPQTVLDTLATTPTFDYQSIIGLNNMDLLAFIALVILFIIPGLDPAIFQRITLSKDIYQAKESLYIATLAFLFILVITFWVAILLLSNAPELNADDLVGYIINNFTYVGLKGLLLSGVMAMLMSTADSYINSASILFAHDVCLPLELKIAKDNELLLYRIFAIVIGVFALLLALSASSLFGIIVTMASFYMPIVTVPLILAIFGFQTTKKMYMFSIIIGFVSTILFRYISTIDGAILTVVSLIIVGTSIITGHYLFKGENVNNTETKKLKNIKSNTEHESRSIINESIRKIKNFNFIYICKNNAPRNELTYSLFGLFCIVATYSTMYSMPIEIRQQHTGVLDFIYHSVLIIATCFLTYPIWPLTFKNQKFISVFWVLGLLYTMSFVSTVQLIISQFGQFQLMTFLLSMVVLSVLVKWRLALLLIIIGVISGIQFFKLQVGTTELPIGITSAKFKIMYVLLVISGILIAFFKPQQEQQEKTETRVGELGRKVNHYGQKISDQQQEISRLEAMGQRIINNVNHELRLPVGNVMNFAQMIYSGLESYSKDQLKELSNEVYKNSNRLSTMILNMLDLSALKANELKLQKQIMNFSELVQNRINICKKIYLDNKKLKFELDISPDILIKIDPNYIRQVIDNLIINSINYSKQGTINITVKSDDNHVIFEIEDEGIGIPKLEIYDIFKPFQVSSKTMTPAEGRGVGLALCKRAIDAHDGTIEAYSDGSTGATFKCILPILPN